MGKLVLAVLKLTYVGTKHELNRLTDAISMKLLHTQHTHTVNPVLNEPPTHVLGVWISAHFTVPDVVLVVEWLHWLIFLEEICY